jgi:hypothetical protein
MNDSGAPKGATDETTAKLSGHSVDGGSDRRRIIRSPRPTRDFAILRNEVLRDTRLSFRALGILAYVLSRPDNWRESAKELAAQGREGRGAILRALTELEEAGYRQTVRRRDPVTGRVSSAVTWYDQPQPPRSRNPTPVTEVQESDPGPGSSYRTPDNRTPDSWTPLEDGEEDREEDSSLDLSSIHQVIVDTEQSSSELSSEGKAVTHARETNGWEDQELEEQERSDETEVVSGSAPLSPPCSTSTGDGFPERTFEPVPAPIEQAREVVESVGLTDAAFVAAVTITAVAEVTHPVPEPTIVTWCLRCRAHPRVEDSPWCAECVRDWLASAGSNVTVLHGR